MDNNNDVYFDETNEKVSLESDNMHDSNSNSCNDESDSDDSEDEMSDDSNNDKYNGYNGYNEYSECDKDYYYHDKRYKRKGSLMINPIIFLITA